MRPARPERADHTIVGIMIAMLLAFLLTTFVTPLQGEFTDNARWGCLLGAFAYLSIRIRRFPPASGLPAIIFAVICLLSSLRSDYRTLCLAKLAPATLSLLIFYYALPGSAGRRTCGLLLVRFAWLMNILAALSLAHGLLTGAFLSIGRYHSLFGGPNSEGIWTATASLSALWLWGRKGSPRWRTLLLGSVLVNATVVYATGSRSSFFGLLAGGAVWGMFQVLRAPSRRSRTLLAFGLAILAASAIGREYYRARWSMMMRTQTGESFLSSRMNRWEASFAAYQRNPRLGHGFGVSEMTRNEQWELGARANATVRDGAGYLAMLESIGWMGTGAFALIVLQALRMQWRVFRRRLVCDEAFLSQSAFAVSAFLLVNLIGEPWILGPGSPTFHVFWLHLAGSVTFAAWALDADRKVSRRPLLIHRIR